MFKQSRFTFEESHPAAWGSLTSITIIFQSASPSSIMARVPSTFTSSTSPLLATLENNIEILFLLRLTPLANLTAVDGVVVSHALSALIFVVWVLPGLREGPVIPDVAVMRKAVGHISKFAFLLVLNYRVESSLGVNLHLGVGPSRKC